eukprot:669741-Rhodomonas_salina.1
MKEEGEGIIGAEDRGGNTWGEGGGRRKRMEAGGRREGQAFTKGERKEGCRFRGQARGVRKEVNSRVWGGRRLRL